MKKILVKKFSVFMTIFYFLLSTIFPSYVLANTSSTSATTVVAELTIYSCSNSTTSSFNTSGHSYISIKNIGTSDIQIGLLTGISPGKMMSVGTWGTKKEHRGVWYNLEAYLYETANELTNSVSLSMQLTSSQLTTVNNYIKKHDAWSELNNCSCFSSNLWNSVSLFKVDAGIPNTPDALKNSIKRKSKYSYGKALSQDYSVYYAHGKSAPQKSTEFN